jgi:hypothetical protein
MLTLCEVCKRSVEQHGITVYRVNETGISGIWRCKEHLDQPRDSEEMAFVEDLEWARDEMKRKGAP